MKQRELKFRAWHKLQKKMYRVVTLKHLCEAKGFSHGLLYEDLEVMQFTGLTDKNGKEIYEGDIVLANGIESVLDYDFSNARKFVSPTIQDSRHFEKRRSAYEVYWQDNFSQFSFMSLSTPKHSIETDVSKRELEVIGNIYETPDLLTPQPNP